MRPEFLAINPNHQVPALVDGDVSLWESGAIGAYLAGKADRTDLWPASPAAQADVLRWMLWNHTQWSPHAAAITFERVVKPFLMKAEPNEDVVAEKLVSWRKSAAVLDAHLSSREWLALGHLTLADIAVASTIMYAVPARFPLADYPHVAAWFARVGELDAWKATAPPM